jgi:hypothetical protein
MSKAITRMSLYLALFILLGASLVTGAFAQETPFFTSGNLVVSVEGCGVHGGTCTTVPNGTGTGTGNSSVGGYGDNQGAPLTLFQYVPTGTASATFVNSLVLPQAGSAADLPVSGEYGSSSEAMLQLSSTGQYLTIMGYGINAAVFDANPDSYGAAPSGALAQSGSLTGQSYTPVPRVATLIDPYGNVNSSTAIYNIFNTNNPRSAYTLNGTTAYVSGQGTGSDSTGGVFYVPVGATDNAPIAITGLDTSSKTIAQDTRDVQIYNNTLYVSVDSKEGSGSARDFIGTLGSPPATSLYSSGAGPTQLTGFGSSSSGKETITTGSNSNGNNLNAGLQINLSPVNYFFASPSVLYVADSGDPKNNSATSPLGDGGLQKWINSSSNGTGTWSLAYTLYQGLNLVANSNSDGTSGLYGLAVTVSGNTVQLYATNYTLSDLDYTYLYGITDNLTFTTASQASGESFTMLDAAPPDSNFKGVALAPTLPAGSATITSSPSGLAFTSTGTGCAPGTYTTPVTLIWTPGNPCSLSVVTPQIVAGAQYVFTQWGDGTTSTTDTVTAPTTSAVYTADFNTTPAGLYSPAPGSTLAGNSVTFQWYGPPNNAAFWIDVGSSAGGNNYHQSGSLPTTTLSATVTSLPTDGSTIYVTLYWLINGSWVSNPYTYTALNATGSAAGMITAPIPGSMLTGSSATFVWTAGSGGATAYWLDVGRAAGGNQYLQSGNLGDVMQLTVNGLPTDGSMVFVTLYSLIGGVWAGNAYTYTAFNASGAGSCLPTAISPGAGTTLSGSSQLFSWTPSQAAGCSTSVTGYWLDAGTAASENEYYQSGNLGTATSVTAVNLPQDGSAVQVTLWTLYGGQWYSSVYNYTAQ